MAVRFAGPNPWKQYTALREAGAGSGCVRADIFPAPKTADPPAPFQFRFIPRDVRFAFSMPVGLSATAASYRMGPASYTTV